MWHMGWTTMIYRHRYRYQDMPGSWEPISLKQDLYQRNNNLEKIAFLASLLPPVKNGDKVDNADLKLAEVKLLSKSRRSPGNAK